jgi:hypothetical protein
MRKFTYVMVVLCLMYLTLLASDRLRLDVLYVDDYLTHSVELNTISPTLLTFSRDGTAVLDKLPKGQKVVLVGFGGDRYLVGTRTPRGKFEGWVLPEDLEPIPEEAMAEINKKIEETKKLKQAIEQGTIAIGMTLEMVEKVLGKPKAKSSITEAGGVFQQWTYNEYKSVPYHVQNLANGTNFISTLYRKVPIGTKIVTFQDGKVMRFETKEEDSNVMKGNLVIPPVIIQ